MTEKPTLEQLKTAEMMLPAQMRATEMDKLLGDANFLDRLLAITVLAAGTCVAGCDSIDEANERLDDLCAIAKGLVPSGYRALAAGTVNKQ